MSPEQVQTFRDQGFVHIPHLFDLATVERLLSWTDEMVARPERPGEHMVYYEDDLQHPGKRVLSRIENFCPYHEQFDALLRRGALKQCVDEAMETDAVLFKEKVNFKLPGADGFKAHQDAQAGWNTYAPYHVTVLVSLDATTVENGCLEIAPCPGGQSLIGDLWSPLSDDQFDPARYQSLPTAPGDAVLFDSYVPHRSEPNRTEQPRRVLYVTYNRQTDGDHRAQYYADKRASYPPDCEREADTNYAYRV